MIFVLFGLVDGHRRPATILLPPSYLYTAETVELGRCAAGDLVQECAAVLKLGRLLDLLQILQLPLHLPRAVPPKHTRIEQLSCFVNLSRFGYKRKVTTTPIDRECLQTLPVIWLVARTDCLLKKVVCSFYLWSGIPAEAADLTKSGALFRPNPA